MRAQIDASICVVCGMCVSAAPEAFFMDEKGRPHGVEKLVPYVIDDALQVMEDCPVGAISIR